MGPRVKSPRRREKLPPHLRSDRWYLPRPPVATSELRRPLGKSPEGPVLRGQSPQWEASSLSRRGALGPPRQQTLPRRLLPALLAPSLREVKPLSDSSRKTRGKTSVSSFSARISGRDGHLKKNVPSGFNPECFPPRLTREVALIVKGFYPSACLSAGDFLTHLENKFSTMKLRKSQWPKYENSYCWPSSPTIVEIAAAYRKGWVQYPTIPAPSRTSRVSLARFNSEAELAKLIVRRNVVGIRSGEEVPRKFLKYFRYRWNFLILAVDIVPIGLARFLASKWLCKPSSLWLERPRALKSYLREVPVGIINTAQARSARLQEFHGAEHADLSQGHSVSEQDFPAWAELHMFDYSYE